MSMIEFNNVHKVYDDGTKAVTNVSLHINDGEFITLIGPSGCGKTTTMKMINRLIEPTSGEIYINDTDIRTYNIHELRWNIGYVLQEIALFPHMTVEENIAVVPELKKWKRKIVRQRIDELLEMVGLDPATYRKKMPSELSGGQQQRIGVVRALAANPDIVLMDEPFSALDPISREQLQHDIRKVQKNIHKTIVFVTHDMDEALALGDRVCFMQNGEIIQVDTPEKLLLHPKTSFVKDFLGDRKSPWQTPITVVANQSQANIITEDKFRLGMYPKNKILIIKSAANRITGIVNQGERLNLDPLESDTPLYKAADILLGSNVSILPVVKDNKLIGTISYQDIIQFLQANVKWHNGVIK